jgi:folylpolyglutamate synthase/dihydropteroate synthase
MLENFSVANAAVEFLGFPEFSGMRNFYWPCRMERFEYSGLSVILDGCHNVESVRLFLDAVREQHQSAEIVCLFGAGKEKTADGMIKVVFELSDHVVFTQSTHFKSYPESQLVEMVPIEGRSKLVQTTLSKHDPSGTIEDRFNLAREFSMTRYQ